MSRKVIVNGESICYLPPVEASEIRYDLGSGNYSNVQTKLEAALTATGTMYSNSTSVKDILASKTTGVVTPTSSGKSSLAEYIQSIYSEHFAIYSFAAQGFNDLPTDNWGYTVTVHAESGAVYVECYSHLSNNPLLCRGMNGNLQWVGWWHSPMLWEDITSSCVAGTGVTSLSVYVNRALKLIRFKGICPTGMSNQGILFYLPANYTFAFEQYFGNLYDQVQAIHIDIVASNNGLRSSHSSGVATGIPYTFGGTAVVNFT